MTNNSDHIFSNIDIRKLLIPIMLENLLASLMGTVDTMMVSNVGASAVSAVSLVDSINILVIQALSALAAGGAILCSQYIGSSNPKGANRAARQVFLVMTVLSVFISAICLVLRVPMLKFIFGSVEAEVMADSQAYFLFTLLSFPFIGLYDAGASIMRAQKDSKSPMTISIISNFLNIGGNAILIFGLGMGVAGAALSTLASRVFCAVVVVIKLRNPSQTICVNRYYTIHPDWDLIKRVLCTRISQLFPDIPKPMIPVCEIPILEREICSLREQGFIDIILTVGYKSEVIINHFDNGEKYGVHIDYFVEKELLGNAGALFKLKDTLVEDFLLLNADAMFNVDFNRFVEFHKAHNGLVTLFTHPNNHPYDSGLIIANKDKQVEQWLTKEDKRPEFYQNRVNAGLHVISPEVLNIEVTTAKVDLDRQVLKPLCGTGKMYCYDSPEYVKDMGTPERYNGVCKDFKLGIIESRNLKNKQKAIFLDGDGTINKYVGFLRKVEQFELLNGVSKAIREINQSEYLAVVVTNQPVIARGEVTYEGLQKIHNKMETLLGK